MFALVEFIKSNDIAVVPMIWLKDKFCSWPFKDAGKLAKEMVNPKPDWTRHEVRVRAVYVTYDEAKKNEKKFEDTSNLDTTDEETLGKGKRMRKRTRFEMESTSSEDEVEKASRISFPPIPVLDECDKAEMSSFTLTTESITVPPKNYQVIAESSQIPLANCSHTKNDGVDQSKLLKEIMHMKVVQKDQSDMISRIFTALNNILDRLPIIQPAITGELVLPVNLPLETKEDLLVLEEALNDEGIREYLCEKLSQIGGTSLGNSVRRMLMRLMSNKLAMGFSWLGLKGKEAFAPLKINTVLMSAIRRNPSFSHCSDNDVESVVKDWLRHAKARSKE